MKALLGFLHAARVRGYAVIDEVFAPGMSAIAVPVQRRGETIGVISVAGPRTRLSQARMHEMAPAGLQVPCRTTGLSQARMHEMAPDLLAAAAELGPICNTNSLFGRPPLGKG